MERSCSGTGWSGESNAFCVWVGQRAPGDWKQLSGSGGRPVLLVALRTAVWLRLSEADLCVVSEECDETRMMCESSSGPN